MRLLPVLFLASCAKSEVNPPAPQPGEQPAPAPAAEGPILYADATRTAAAIPARFSAPLPASLTALQGDWSAAPPQVLVKARLCQGHAATWEALGTAVDAALAQGDPLDEVVRGYAELLRYCASPRSCPPARAWATEQPAGSVRARLGWSRLSECPDAVDLFRTDAAPDGTLAAFWFDRPWNSEPEYVPALGAALRRLATGGDSWVVRQAAVAHGMLDDPRVAADLLAARDAATDEQVRASVIAGMGKQSDPRLGAVFAAHCAQPDVRETLCPGKASVEIGAIPATAPEDPEAALRDPAVLRAALQEGEHRASRDLFVGLRALATRDWAAAHALAATLESGPATEPDLTDLVRSLRRFASRAEVEAAVRPVGTLRAAAGPESWITPAELLAERGSAHWFDVETGMYPNEHDGLLAELAALAGPPLSEVVFAELAPPLEGAADPTSWAADVVVTDGGEVLRPPDAGGSYRLFAWTGTERFEVAAQDLGDWYDLGAVLGLLNTLARALGQEVRYVTLPTGDQTAIVLAAPGPALQAAVADGLLRLEGAGAAEAEGKAFEQEVFRKIEAGEWE
jgi:hypothetical protein